MSDKEWNLTKESSEETLNDYNTIPEDAHVLHLWEPLKFKVDEYFLFVHHSVPFKILSYLLYIVAYPILWLLQKVFLGFTVEGLENLKGVDSGKITVSNHVHVLDCTMMGTAQFPQKIYFTSLESNFKIPIVKELITLFNTIPIPSDRKFMPSFTETINQLLQDGQTVHFYPEGSLWPYYDRVREFKKGAFYFAVTNNVPIIPCVFSFHPVTGMCQYIRKKPFVKMSILLPVYPDNMLPKQEAIRSLKEQVQENMKQKLKEVCD